MMVRQAIRVGFLERTAKDSAAAICAGSCPSTRFTAQPWAAKRCSTSSEHGERGVAVDRDVVVVVQHGQLRRAADARRAPIASWLTPSIRSPSRGDHPGAVIDQRLAEARGQHALGERHADRGGQALAERPGGGLDRRMLAVFGMPGGGRVQLAEALQVVDRPCRRGRSGAAAHRAASSRGRPTARSGRGPASAGRRRRISGTGSTARWRRRPCPSACRDGPIAPPRSRRSPARGWHRPSAAPASSRAAPGARAAVGREPSPRHLRPRCGGSGRWVLLEQASQPAPSCFRTSPAR